MKSNFVSCVNNEYQNLWDNESEDANSSEDSFIPLNSVKTDIYYEIRTAAAAKALAEYRIEHDKK